MRDLISPKVVRAEAREGYFQEKLVYHFDSTASLLVGSALYRTGDER